MRKFILTTFLLCVLSTNLAYANTNIPVYFGDVQLKLSKSPVLKNGAVLVPFRDIFETLGYSVYYDSSSQRIESKKNGSIITLFVGSKYANISGLDHNLTVAPQSINGVTMVPLRFVSEAAGYNVEWKSDENNIKYIAINYFDENSVTKTAEYLKQEAINNSISAYQKQVLAEKEAKNKELQKYQDYDDKKNAILREYRSQWISETELVNLHKVYATWMGEYIIFQKYSNEEIILRIDGSPKEHFESGKVYYGNGVHYQYIDILTYPIPEAPDGSGKFEIRVKDIVYSVPDLKSLGIIK